MRGWIERDRHLAALDDAIAKGIADAEAGRVQSLDLVRDEINKRLASTTGE